MVSTDMDHARSRYLSGLRHVLRGIEMQRERILERARMAPRLLPGTEHEVVDLTDTPGNDLDYYIYELGRLQDIAREMITTFDRPQEVADALALFDLAVPGLRDARNPLTHIDDTPRLDDIGWFSALVRLPPGGGRPVYLVDPRHQHHSAAQQLGSALQSYLRSA